MPIVTPEGIKPEYDAVIVGSGFGSLFYVHALNKRRPNWRVLILEWGQLNDRAWQLKHQKNSSRDPASTFHSDDEKIWNFTVGYGGGTNCWFGQTPRFLPSDFRTKSLYGVGQDWPISYDDLEPDYCEAESIMSIAGPADISIISPRSMPYPLRPHRMTTPDTIMKEAQPDKHFALPTARASVAIETRSGCCDSARCNLCPVDAKFTALNGFQHLLKNENNDICFDAQVLRFEHTNGTVSRVVFQNQGREMKVAGSLFVLGANALQSPPILLRSDINHPLTGRGLNEQIGMNFEVFLDGVNNFDGSTITTGINLSAYEGEFRKTMGSALIYFENRWVYELRKEWGRWRESLPLTIAIENPPQDENFVSIDKNGEAFVRYTQDSPYGLLAAEAMKENLPNILAPLPVEKIVYKGRRATESHIQGTLRMGNSREDSVVGRDLLHHDVRNLVVVGTSLFPTCPPMNPSLTAAALSLWGTRQLLT